MTRDVISRQAVLDTEYQIKDINGVEYVMLSEVQMKMRKLPSVTPTQKNTLENTLDDAISREDARMMLTCEIKDGMTITEYIKMVDKRLRKLSPVTQKPDNKYRKEAKRWKNKWLKAQKSGKWIAQQEANGDDYFKAYDISGVMTYAAKYKCDKCGFIQICIEDHGQYKYCPNCSADMRGDAE